MVFASSNMQVFRVMLQRQTETGILVIALKITTLAITVIELIIVQYCSPPLLALEASPTHSCGLR